MSAPTRTHDALGRSHANNACRTTRRLRPAENPGDETPAPPLDARDDAGEHAQSHQQEKEPARWDERWIELTGRERRLDRLLHEEERRTGQNEQECAVDLVHPAPVRGGRHEAGDLVAERLTPEQRGEHEHAENEERRQRESSDRRLVPAEVRMNPVCREQGVEQDGVPRQRTQGHRQQAPDPADG